MGVDPRPHTLADVWDMACGRWDLEVSARAFWQRQFGSEVTAAQELDMHPLRRTPRPPPRAKSEAERKAESRRAWSATFEFFGGKYTPTPSE